MTVCSASCERSFFVFKLAKSVLWDFVIYCQHLPLEIVEQRFYNYK
nr:MAG TPA: hypothetical protein [Caudoviricetes sp.]